MLTQVPKARHLGRPAKAPCSIEQGALLHFGNWCRPNARAQSEVWAAREKGGQFDSILWRHLTGVGWPDENDALLTCAVAADPTTATETEEHVMPVRTVVPTLL